MELSLLLSELLSTDRVRVPLCSHSKADLLRELVHLAVGGAGDRIVDGVVEAVEAREAEVSTALGGGLAVPHGRTDLVSDVGLAAGTVRDVPDYVAIDGTPVRVAFLVLTPTRTCGEHVRLLSRIARIMHDVRVRDRLLASTSAEQFIQVIHDAEVA